MTTPSGPGPRHVLAILAATVGMGLIRLVLGSSGEIPAQVGLAVDALAAGAVAFAAVSVGRSPRDERSRRAWWFLAAFPIAWLLAPVAWALGLPVLADVGRAVAVLFVGASWWFAARAGGSVSRLRLVGDGAIGAAAVLAIGWSGPLGRAWQEAGTSAEAFAAVGLPVAMIGTAVLGAGLTLTEMESRHRARPALFLVAMLILAASDVAWAMGAPPVWAAGWVAYALTIRTQLTPSPRVAPAPTRARHVFLPYALIAPAGLVLLLRSRDGLDAPEIAAGFAIGALLVIRQHLTLLENDALVRRLRETEAQLRYQATHDSLTGLPGRAELLRHLDGLAAGTRPGSGHVALAFIDVDFFKDVNDRYGHATGDALLVEVARRLRASIRDQPDAFAARLGGDEFAVLVSGDRAVDASSLAASVAAAVDGPIMAGSTQLPVSASVGAAAARSDGLDPSELLHEADLAMYAVKRSRTAGEA